MIILASKSPRRRELLQMLGVEFVIGESNADEISEAEEPADMTMEIAIKKAMGTQRRADDIVIGADTVVVIDGKPLGKPKSEEQAYEMLKMLSGRTHSVYTGVCLLKNGESECFCSKTDVTFYELTDDTIRWYIGTKEPMDKAGGYGIQGKGALLVERINGDYYNVVGLPIGELNRHLRRFIQM